MRGLVHDALAGAREFMADAVGELRAEAKLSDDEVLARYQVHRGDPAALLAFVEQSTGQTGLDALREGVRYEQRMEALQRSRGG